MYRPSANPPRGRWGRFLDRKRRERNWSQTQAFEALREGLGLGPKSRASYVAMEAGRPLRPHEEAFLESYFGEAPSEESELPSGPSDPVVAALDRQTEALNRLSDSILEVLQGQREGMTEIAAAVGLVLHRLGGLPEQMPNGPTGRSTSGAGS